MAAAANARLPVHLRVGDVESMIGTLDVEFHLDREPLSHGAVGIAATAGDIRSDLVAFLRAAADRIEKNLERDAKMEQVA